MDIGDPSFHPLALQDHILECKPPVSLDCTRTLLNAIKAGLILWHFGSQVDNDHIWSPTWQVRFWRAWKVPTLWEKQVFCPQDMSASASDATIPWYIPHRKHVGSRTALDLPKPQNKSNRSILHQHHWEIEELQTPWWQPDRQVWPIKWTLAQSLKQLSHLFWNLFLNNLKLITY